MDDEKDRFGEKIRLLERAREDVYFSERDRELIEKMKARLQRVERAEDKKDRVCPQCSVKLESYLFMEIVLDRCSNCEGVWLDKGELDMIANKINESPFASFLSRFFG